MENKTTSLHGKTVVLLGASSGIGLATAQAAAAEGANIIIVSANQQRLDNALKELPQEAKAYAVDVTNEEQIKDLFTKIGKFDHLVYTAGENIQIGNISDTKIEAGKKYFNVRYWGAFTAVKYAAAHINVGGSIVLTSGAASQRPGKGWSLGASMCAAMEGFTRAMAVELSPIRVNVVVPGIVKTNLWNSLPDTDREALYVTYADMLLVKHIGEAAEVAQTYIYLMKQTYSTGQTVVVDGGGVLV